MSAFKEIGPPTPERVLEIVRKAHEGLIYAVDVAWLADSHEALRAELKDLKAELAHCEAMAREGGWDPDQTNATYAQWLIDAPKNLRAELTKVTAERDARVNRAVLDNIVANRDALATALEDAEAKLFDAAKVLAEAVERLRGAEKERDQARAEAAVLRSALTSAAYREGIHPMGAGVAECVLCEEQRGKHAPDCEVGAAESSTAGRALLEELEHRRETAGNDEMLFGELRELLDLDPSPVIVSCVDGVKRLLAENARLQEAAAEANQLVQKQAHLATELTLYTGGELKALQEENARLRVELKIAEDDRDTFKLGYRAARSTVKAKRKSRKRPLCAKCKHTDLRHRKGGKCAAQRSTPGGRVYPCACLKFTPPKARRKGKSK